MPLNVWQVDAAQMTPFYNLALCEGLSQVECEVTYITSRYLYTQLTYPKAINVQHLYFRGIDGNWLKSVPGLRKILRGIYYPLGNLLLYQKIKAAKPDIVHFQWSRLPYFDLPLIRAIQRLGIPVVQTIHDVTPLYDNSGSLNKLYDIYRQCDGLIVHSNANRETLQQTVADLVADRIFIIPHLELSFPAPADVSSQLARQQLSIHEEAFVVLFQGTVKHYKGIDVLYETIQQINQLHHKVYWLIVGKSSDAQQKSYLEAIANLQNTSVLDRFIPNEELWMYYEAADISVFPYRHIFQSGALITAMGFGLPIVATDVGSFAETIDTNGIIVPKEDPTALATAIIKMIEQADLQAMRQRSSEIIRQYHKAEKVGQSLQDIYHQILA